MEPVFLTLDEIVEMHRQQIERYGGSAGIRDPAALQAAVAMPMASFDGAFLHPSLASMAAAYLFHICQNHAFVDGNKRAAANASITFLLMNGWEPAFTEDELADLVMRVASGTVGKIELTAAFESKVQPLDVEL